MGGRSEEVKVMLTGQKLHGEKLKVPGVSAPFHYAGLLALFTLCGLDSRKIAFFATVHEPNVTCPRCKQKLLDLEIVKIANHKEN